MLHHPPAAPPPGMWYELSCRFAPERIVPGEEEEEPLPACRVLECADMHDRRVLNRTFVDPPPAALKTGEVTGCLKETFARHGPPAGGVFVSPGAWLSARELLLTEETREQGRALFENGVAFPAMSRADREELQKWAARRRLQCCFEREGVF